MTQTPMRIDVLIWLPSETEPVFAGQILSDRMGASFRYDPAYLGHKKAISIYGDDLKMNMYRLDMGAIGVIAPSLRDALPDRWGRRAIAAGLNVSGGARIPEDQISDLTVMLHTGPDRIGALDFRLPGQAPPVEKVDGATLEELMALADLIEEGAAVPPDLGHLIPQVASVGGARPKSLFTDTKTRQKFIAKFTAKADTYPVVAAEFVAMRLAAYAGINVAPVEIAKIGRREVLLVERFDRTALPTGGWGRKAIVSALTWTHEAELSAHHISYQQLAETITDGFEEAAVAHTELFTRLAFNILVGNTDDHARNHAAFWDGATHELTPAYDIAPQRRASREANQAMVISDGSRAAQLRNASAVAHHFGLSESMTLQIYDRLIAAIMDNWVEVCDEAALTRVERDALAGRQFLNAYAFEGQRAVPHLP
jgi:serine/threonine-protein kinase HipA